MPIDNNLQLKGLSFYLVTQGYLDEQKAFKILRESLQKRIPFITYLGQENYLCYRSLALAVANYFGLAFFDLDNYDLTILPKDIFKTEFIQQHSVLPLFIRDKKLILGVTDPSLHDLNDINFLTGLSTILVIVEIDKLTKIINSIYANNLHRDLQLEDDDLHAKIKQLNIEDSLDNDLSYLESAKSPVVKFLNKILLDAVHQLASDIHFEPYENYYRIRYRLDGILHEMNRQSIKVANFITARLKIMANLDISERRKPQDGRFKINLAKNHSIDFRLNTCPTLFGEKSAVRILKSTQSLIDIDNLGMSELQKQLFKEILSHSQGMILVTGPTGSGKTVTLYSALDKLNTSDVNISTVEDPIEIQLPGINQVQINNKTGLTFSSVLRAFLRQDPDIIMVGEIRDQETAEIAVRAAQTGHLVLSTLHTNSAAEVLIRLLNMGIASFNIASSIILIVAQRLIRLLCPYCKVKVHKPYSSLLQDEIESETLESAILYQAVGCLHCNQGYKGRIGIFELLPISKCMVNRMSKKLGSSEIIELANEANNFSLRRSGLEKVISGITSFEEINRVIN